MGAEKAPRKRKPRAKRKPRDPDRKRGTEVLTEVVAGLADPDTPTMSRVRKVASALDLEKVVDIIDSSEGLMSAVRELLSRGENRYTLVEAAEKADMTVQELTQLNLACGFANPEPDARVLTEEDVEVMRLFKASAVIFGDDVAIQNVRVMGSAMSRVADAFVSSFATVVGRQSTERELSDEDLMQANETVVALLPSAVQAMDVLLRRHLELKSRPDFLLGAEWEGVDAVDRAIGFCDLVGYTTLTQQISDKRLASILKAFETTASDLITEKGANLVKLIGDEVMFVAPDAVTGADVGLSLAESFGRGDALPPVRCGLAAGRVIVREGDYHGPVVNLAARIVKLAEPGTVLVPDAIAGELKDSYRLHDEGQRDLKGFNEPVHLHRLQR